MEMRPESVAKLLTDYPETKELIAYLAHKADEVNTISDLDVVNMPASEMAIEVIARRRAYDKLCEILKMFIEHAPMPASGPKVDEYGVDVESLDKQP